MLLAQCAIAFEQLWIVIQPGLHQDETLTKKGAHFIACGQFLCGYAFHHLDFIGKPLFSNSLQQRLFALKKAVNVGWRHSGLRGKVGH